MGVHREGSAVSDRVEHVLENGPVLSRDLDGFLSRGKELFSRVVHVVKGRYGWKSEKLAEWGLQPQRPTVTPKLPPPETVQSTDQAAHSQTDSAQ